MDHLLDSDQIAIHIGEDWVAAVAGQDFARLTSLVHPQVHSRLLIPNHFYDLEEAGDLVAALRRWFGAADAIQIIQTRVQAVGRRLGIFYHFRAEEQGQSFDVEQQIYAFLAGGRIDQLDLICSGFQPDADALLVVNARSETFGSTCALLTPSIKARLREMASGQVLEVRVDDPSVREDVEAWCRLSGNELLKMNTDRAAEIQFFLKKK